MNVVVIEDEQLTAQRLISMVKKYDISINVLAQISSVAGAISWFESHSLDSIDLVFMDIHLEDGDSFQIVSKLNLKTPIIFTTAFDEYMISAFKVNSVDYLLKPVNYDELAAALTKFKSLRFTQANIKTLMNELGLQNNQQFKDRFMVTVGTKIRPVKTESIAYFYLEEKTVLLVTTDGTHAPDRLQSRQIDPGDRSQTIFPYQQAVYCVAEFHSHDPHRFGGKVEAALDSGNKTRGCR